MWRFSKRGSRLTTPAPKPDQLPKREDFSNNDASIKVWLPQLLVDRLNWLSVEKAASRPDLMRAFIFIHLYGHIAYQSLCNPEPSKQAVSPAPSGNEGSIRMSRYRTTIVDLREIGKSDEDITIGLPAKMKDDLKELSKLHGLDASSYVRKLLVLELLGEKVHAKWQTAIGKLSPDLAKIERD
jgi:hypothetical protein